MKKFKVEGEVWKWEGPSAWYFIYIGDKESERIKKDQEKKVRRGFGSVRIQAKLGNTKWSSSIFPTKEGPYIFPIKALVRKKESIREGDKVKIQMETI